MVVELEFGKGPPEWTCHFGCIFRVSSGIASSRKPSQLLPPAFCHLVSPTPGLKKVSWPLLLDCQPLRG